MPTVTLVTDREGNTRHLLAENDQTLLQALGDKTFTYRNSHVELGQDLSVFQQTNLQEEGRFNAQKWYADMGLVLLYTVLGPFDTRAQALEEEIQCLLKHNLPLPQFQIELLQSSS